VLAGNEPEHPADPALAELEIDVEPAVVAEDVTHGLRDAIELGIAGVALALHALEAECHAPGVAAGEDDDVPIVVVGDDAPAAEVSMLDDAAETEARGGRHRNTALSSLLGTVSRTHVKAPLSFISRAPLRKAANASLDNAPPTLMRLTPAPASCSTVSDGSAALITTFTGFFTDEVTVRIVARSLTPGA